MGNYYFIYPFVLFLIINLNGCSTTPSRETLENCEEDHVRLLKATLMTSNSSMDHKEIANILEEVRQTKVQCMAISEVLSAMLPHNAEIYRNRDKWDVLRLRAYIILVLGEIGFPDSAFPYLVDVLAFIDERMNVLEVGSSIRVVSQLKERGHLFKGFVMNAFNKIFSEEEFSLSTYQFKIPIKEATTIQIEVVKTLGKIGKSTDTDIIDFLNSVLANRAIIGYDRRVLQEAELALNFIKEKKGTAVFNMVFKAKKTEEEMLNEILNSGIAEKEFEQLNDIKVEGNGLWMEEINFMNHDGYSQTLKSIINKPLLITFFYTRCQNEGKCSATIAHLAALQYQLENFNLQHEVKLLAASYEPKFDTPQRLKRYALNRGVNLSSYAQAIRFDLDDQQRVLNQLNSGVGYNNGWVNSHEVEAFLINVNGRIAARYNSLLWNQSKIINDIQNLKRN